MMNDAYIYIYLSMKNKKKAKMTGHIMRGFCVDHKLDINKLTYLLLCIHSIQWLWLEVTR